MKRKLILRNKKKYSKLIKSTKKTKIIDYIKLLYSGKWVDNHSMANNTVTCIRCFKSYVIKDAPRTVPGTDGYYIKEPKCPNCGCRLYFSHL